MALSGLPRSRPEESTMMDGASPAVTVVVPTRNRSGQRTVRNWLSSGHSALMVSVKAGRGSSPCFSAAFTADHVAI